jgi:1-phosphofructokinase family hexose kinase
MSKAVCITPNTAIDHVIRVGELVLGSTLRAESATLVPAGKGVCVAAGVAALGGRAVATGFVGERSSDLFDGLHSEHIEPRFVEVPGSTRVNVTLLESTRRETHVQTTGYAISAEDVTRLDQLVEELVSAGDIVVISGSVPPGTPRGLTAHLVELGKTRGAHVILDASGCALREGAEQGPHMIKPNLTELRQLVGRDVEDADDAVVRAARGCLAWGVRRVVVSRGAKGLVAVDAQGAWRAFVDVGRDEATASVGSGDAVVAAYVVGAFEQRSPEDTLRLAAACGAANLLTHLPGRFIKSDVDRLAPLVSVERLA